MTLITKLESVCRKLAPAGWRELLLRITDRQLDITADNLAEELAKPLDAIDRSHPGFEDFAHEGRQAIEPGKPLQDPPAGLIVPGGFGDPAEPPRFGSSTGDRLVRTRPPVPRNADPRADHDV